MAIRYGRPTWQNRRIIEIFEVDIFPVCAPSFIHGNDPLKKPEDLRRHTLLHDQEKEMWPRWLAATGTNGIDGSLGHRFPGSVDLLAAAEAGLGVAIGDTVICDRGLRRGSLVRPFDRSIPAADSYHVIVPDVEKLPELTQTFLNWLLDQAAEFKSRSSTS